MSRLTRDGSAKPVSRDQIFRRERGQGNLHFPRTADHVQDWQPYTVDPYSCSMCDHTKMLSPSDKEPFICMMSGIYLVAIIGDRDGMDSFSEKLVIVILIQIILILCNIFKCKNDGNGSKPTQFRYFFQIFPNFCSKIWK